MCEPDWGDLERQNGTEKNSKTKRGSSRNYTDVFDSNSLNAPAMIRVYPRKSAVVTALRFCRFAVYRFCRYFLVHWFTQSLTVFHQSWEFCGFRTQWPSSGK